MYCIGLILFYFSVSLTCGETTSENCTYLTMAATATVAGTGCTYTICPASSTVSRIRLDLTVNFKFCLNFISDIYILDMSFHVHSTHSIHLIEGYIITFIIHINNTYYNKVRYIQTSLPCSSISFSQRYLMAS